MSPPEFGVGMHICPPHFKDPFTITIGDRAFTALTVIIGTIQETFENSIYLKSHLRNKTVCNCAALLKWLVLLTALYKLSTLHYILSGCKISSTRLLALQHVKSLRTP